MQPPMQQPPIQQPPQNPTTIPANPATEGFMAINPPVVPYQPHGEGDAMRGYVLTRQPTPRPDQQDAAFYILQLTVPRTQGGRELPAGALIALEEQPCVKALCYLMPKLEPAQPSGELTPKTVHEVIIVPSKRGDSGWLYLIHGRHLLAHAATPPVVRPPPFSVIADFDEGDNGAPAEPPAPSATEPLGPAR